MLTGERSNAIKAFIGFLIFFTLSRTFSIKVKITSFAFVILIFVIICSNVNFIKYRYGQLIFGQLNTIGHVINLIKKTNFKTFNAENQKSFSPKENEEFWRAIGANYFHMYISGVKVFFNYPVFGVGNKNYRIVTCTKYLGDEGNNIYYQTYKSKYSKVPELYNSNYTCNTHTHNIYIEFLAEHGIVGTLILLFVFFKIIYQSFKKINLNKNNLQLSAFTYVVLIFFPLLPNGAFFNNYVATLFWINLSIMTITSKNNDT